MLVREFEASVTVLRPLSEMMNPALCVLPVRDR